MDTCLNRHCACGLGIKQVAAAHMNKIQQAAARYLIHARISVHTLSCTEGMLMAGTDAVQ